MRQPWALRDAPELVRAARIEIPAMNVRSIAKVLLGAMLSASAAGNPAPTGSPAAPGHAAVWQPYDILVHLAGLPRPYSCDELWYKFRGVLVSVGAGRIDEVTPSDCASPSPTVHVRFVLPRLVQGDSAGDEDIQAEQRTVELAPGTVAHLLASDCPLVRQIRQSLLADLPLKVLSSQFACRSGAAAVSSRTSSAPGAGDHPAAADHYAVRIEALMPLWPEPAAAGPG